MILLSFFLDSIITNYYPYTINNLSWFRPCFYMLTLVTVLFYNKKEKYIFEKILILTIIGSLIFNVNLLVRTLIYLLIFLSMKYIIKEYHKSIITYLITILISLFIYYYLSYFIFIFFKETTITITSTTLVFIHSILINCIVGIIIYYLFDIKYKRK